MNNQKLISFRIFVKTKIQNTMKHTTLLLLFVAFAGCLTAYSQQKEAPKRQGWEEDIWGPLYGNVENVTINRYKLSDKFGEIVKESEIYKYFYEFNSKDNLVKRTIYDNGSVKRENIYNYDTQGNVIEEVEDNRDGLLDDNKTLYRYDAQGNNIEQTVYSKTTCPRWLNGSKWIYKYDSIGNKIERAWYYNDGSLNQKWLYKYDSQGNMTESAEYISSGSMEEKILYKYDSQGNMIEEAHYDKKNEFIYKHIYIYKYDSQGNWIEVTKYTSDIMIPDERSERVIVYRE